MAEQAYIYLLEWHWSDGYEHGQGVLGCYSMPSKAEAAWVKWVVAQNDERSEYYMDIRAVVLDEEVE